MQNIQLGMLFQVKSTSAFEMPDTAVALGPGRSAFRGASSILEPHYTFAV